MIKLTNHYFRQINIVWIIDRMKILNGRELSEFIKERQARSVLGLRSGHGVAPKLAIIRTNPDPVVDSYMKLKQGYGTDIEIEVEVHTVDQAKAINLIKKLNRDDLVHGIIVQIPLPDSSQTDEILNAVNADKDVDGLAAKSNFTPATPMAIDWLLAGYNIDLINKHIVIIGHGRLVGKPLAKLWSSNGLDIEVADNKTQNLAEVTKKADVIITATGVPGLVTKDMVKSNVVIVDAGVATDTNGLIGDVASEVRELPDITITAEKGGVGPLTVCALFENVITSARRQAESKK
jgi:methylenetetrahydrofolate dehydrogenase (NADP+)/methenyltetrahydrofolate cyclohydrolase